MCRNKAIILVIFCIYTFQVSGFSIVNNVAVSSDILTNMLFEGIQKQSINLNSTARSSLLYDDQKCVASLQDIIQRFPSLDVLPFIDAWGNLPSGILNGHLQDLGNFDQCTKTSVLLNNEIGLVHGQYCFASIPLLENLASTTPSLGFYKQVQTDLYDNLISLRIAICVPDSCDPKLLTVVFQTVANNAFNGALKGIKVGSCQVDKKPDFETINIVGIVIFSIFGLLLALSTAYDVYTYNFKKAPVPLLLAFSALTNGRKLFAINTKSAPNSIECLNGIRVLSMAWVIYCHNYSLTPIMSLLNFTTMLEWLKKASTMHVVMGTVSVDSFLFISGLLVAWLGLRELDKRKGKLNIPLMYFHRYIRLTPPVMAVMLFILSLNDYIGTGPRIKLFRLFHFGCKKYWWSTILYVQNYVNPDEICIPQSWYLAVDTQLYILSPLILIPLWKWGKKFVPVMFLLSILSIGCVIATYFHEGYTFFMGIFEDNQNGLTYSPTHTRYTVWLIGIGLGYFMYQNKQKKIHLSKIIQFIAWTLSFVTILAVIYGPYFTINADRDHTIFEAAIYETMKRVSWAIALSWIVFACHFGFGGIINAFLSHPYWQPLGRLTYSMYLVHMVVQTIQHGTTKTDVFFSDYTEVQFFWSTFGISIMAAIVLTLTFESPVLVIEKALLRKTETNGSHQNNMDVDIRKIEIANSLQKSV